MKILMATMGLDIGGAETHIVELSKELKSRGHDIVIVSNGGVYVPEILAAGIRHYDAPMHRRSLGEMRRSVAILKEVIERESPDVIHAHARIPAFLCGGLARKMKIPFVTTCHGVYQISSSLKRLSNWGEHTLAVSEDIRDYLLTQYALPREQITLTINGIDTQRFSPEVSGLTARRELGLGEEKVICHVSRLDRETEHTARQLIAVAPQLAEEFPGVRILIVGGGVAFEDLRQAAERTNGQLGYPCLVLTGPRTDVNMLVAAGDLFVGVSRAALEAMAVCKPTVLSGAQGHTGLFVPELLERAVDTNFCCRTDPVSDEMQLLAELRRGLSLSGEEAERLGRFGRSVVLERYSVERMAQDALSVYDRVRRRKYRVVMSGYYGFANTGDDAIQESIRQAFRKTGDEVELVVLSNNPELTRSQYGMEAVPRFHIWKVFSALRHSDLLLSGGGSLLQDATSTRSLLYYLSVISAARMMGKPVALYANGIGPVTRSGNRKRVKKAVERAALVTLRDHSSGEELKKMGVTREDIQVTADPVFHLDPVEESRALELLAQAGLSPEDNFVAVSVRQWPDTEEFRRQLARMCDHISRTYGYKVLFLLMQPSRDLEPTNQVQQQMEEPSWVLNTFCTPTELMGVLGRAKLCLAMRLHMLIFAARMAVPAMGLVYDPKVESYLEELDLPSAGHVSCFDGDEAIRRADELMAHYEEVLAGLKEKSAVLAGAANENEKLLLELLKKTKP